MFDQLIEKIINLMLKQATSIEDLAWILIYVSGGMLIFRLSSSALRIGRRINSENQKKLSNDSSLAVITAKGAKVQDLFHIDHTCKNKKKFSTELNAYSAENKEIKSRLAKIMNILSKEFENKYDRYLFDRDIDPKNDDLL